MRRIEWDVDIVHALELERLARVHLDDDGIRALHIGRGVAERCRWDDVAVLIDGASLDDGDIDMAEITAAGKLCRLGKMQVEVIDAAVVNLVAQHLVGLIRQALLDAMDACEHIIELRARGRARPEVDRERILLHAFGECHRHSLRVSRGREAARGDVHARLDKGRGFLCCDDFRLQSFVADAIENINHQKSPL